MATLQLGDINFGLGVDTKALGSAAKKLADFGRAVDKAAQDTSKGASKIEADMRRQEQSVIRALMQVQNLNTSMRKAGAPDEMYKSTATALRQLTSELTSGQRSALGYQRAMERFQVSIGSARREFEQWKGGVVTGNKFADTLRNMSSAATVALGPLSGVAARIQAITSVMTRSNIVIAGLIVSFTAATVGLYKLSSAAVSTGIEMEKLQRRFEITSEAGQAAADFEMIADLSHRAGTEIVTTANAFTKLQAAARGTGLENNVTQLFEDMIFGAANFQLSVEELDGAMKALEQMLSKGVVQAEELRGQLGDRLVGAFNIAANAMGMTTRELSDLMQQGKLATEDFLEPFAAEFRRAMGAESLDYVDTLQAAINRLSNAQINFSTTLNETFQISRLYKVGLEAITAVIEGVTASLGALKTVAILTSGALMGMAAPTIFAGLMAIVSAINKARLAILALNAAALLNPLTAIPAVMWRVAAGAAAAAFSLWAFRDSSAAAGDAASRFTEDVKALLDAQESVMNMESGSSGLFDWVDSVQDKIVDLSRRREELLAGIDAVNEFRQAAIDGGETAGRSGAQLILEINENLHTLRSELRLTENEIDALDAALREALDSQAFKNISDAANDALDDVRRQVNLLDRQAASYSDVTISLAQLNAEASRSSDLEKLMEQLLSKQVDENDAAAAVDNLRQAYMRLDEAIRDSEIESFTQEIDQLRRQTAVLNDPESAGVPYEEYVKGLERRAEMSRRMQALIDKGVNPLRAATMVNDLRSALEAFDQAQRDAKLRETSAALQEQTDRLNAQTDAMLTGADALAEFNRQQKLADDIMAAQESLTVRGVISPDDQQTLDEWIAARERQLEVERELAENQKRDTLNTFLDQAAQSVDRLRQQAAAATESEDALRLLNNEFARLDSIADFEKRLRDAGASEAEITRRTEEYTAALKEFAEAQADATATRALDESSRNADLLRQEAAATLEGAEALAEFNRQQAEAAEIAKMREALMVDGVLSPEAEAALQDQIKAYQELQAALQEVADQEERLARARSRSSVASDISRLRAQTEAIRRGGNALATLNAEFERKDAFTRIVNSLRDANVSWEEAIALATEYTDAMLENAEAQANNSDELDRLTQSVRDYAEELAAMKAGPDMARAYNDTRSATSAILSYRDGLQKAGLSTNEVNQRVRDLVRTMNELQRETAAQELAKLFEESAIEIEELQRLTAATWQGPTAVSRLREDLNIDRQVRQFEQRMREANAAAQLAEQGFDLPEHITEAKTQAELLHGTMMDIASIDTMDEPVSELNTALLDAIGNVEILGARMQGLSVIPILGADGMGGAGGIPGIVPGTGAFTGALAGGSSGVQQQVWNFFSQRGLSPAQIAGIMGNINAESAFNPYAVGDSGTSFGLFQHHGSRGQGLVSSLGPMGLGNVQGQLEYAWRELQTTERAVLNNLRAVSDVQSATNAFLGFERPQGYSASAPQGSAGYNARLGGAQAALSTFGGSSSDLGIQGSPGLTPIIPDDAIISQVDAYREALEGLTDAERGYRSNEALDAAQRQIDLLRDQVTLIGDNTEAHRLYNEQLARTEAIDQFRQGLEAAGVAQEIVNQKVREFQELLEQRDSMQQWWEASIQFASVLESTYQDAISGIASSWADAVLDITSTEDMWNNLAKLGQQVAKKLLQAFLELYVIKPLLNFIFGGLGGLGNIGAGTISFAAMGDVYPHSALSDYSNSIVSSPTLFAFAKGAGIMGEDGDEAIMPLVRSASGHLGVRAVGGGDGSVEDAIQNLKIHITTSIDESGQLYVRQVASEEAASMGIQVRAGIRSEIVQYENNPWKEN